MAAGKAAEHKLSGCCISHEFFKAASRVPDKIAVIHASGFAGIAHDSAATYPRHDGGIEFSESSSSSGPSVYEGDECFTFSDILTAVENLSPRLRHILDGGDDSSVITNRSANSLSEKSINVSERLQDSSQIGQQLSQFRSPRTPKVVGVYMEPCVEYIVAVLSILRCGEAFMPLDPTWPKARILSILSSSKAELVIGTNLTIEGNFFHRLDTLKWLIEEGSCLVLLLSLKDCIKIQSPPIPLEWPCKCEQPRSFCYLIYTSGSTGKPKGVCGTEIGLLNRYLWMQEMYPPDEGDMVLFKTAISFIDHVQEFLGAILSTCTLVVPPFSQLKENILYIIDYLQGYLINRLVAVPSLMRVIMPSLQSQRYATMTNSLKLLVLSGEVLNIPLCEMLLKLLPKTLILNLYGSTEVTGDCTYFDCRRLPLILEKEILSSVPIGLPLSNCDVVLDGEDAQHQGEIYVSGVCVAAGYFQYPHLMPLAEWDMLQEHDTKCGVQYHFKTGDFGTRLSGGDLVFLGRKDRIIKVNGQRIALEEVEDALRDHLDVVDAAVVSREIDGEILLLEAYVMTKRSAEDYNILKTDLRNWLIRKLPQIMIPSCILFVSSLPLTSAGKIDYLSLDTSADSDQQVRIKIKEIPQDRLIQVIKQVFCSALMVEKVSSDGDFFVMGGNSISAAYASFKLGIHMKLLYTFRTPRNLQMALSSSSFLEGTDAHFGVDLRRLGVTDSGESLIPKSRENSPEEKLFVAENSRDILNPAKKLKTDSNTHVGIIKEQSSRDSSWNSTALHSDCSFSRCNNSTHRGQCEGSYSCSAAWSNILPTGRKGFMQELWKVDLGSCVDASPLIIFKGSDIYMFIGSHSHKFVCIDGKSGAVLWVTGLEGRVECSAAILDDLSQVVVGCYEGNIYFLDFTNGMVCWCFHTNGQVKSQPVVDKCRHLVWCGSYDHNLYAIDYRTYSCVYKLPCEGSIFGSPAIDEMQEKLYVPSTSGHVTALEIQALPFKTLWKKVMGAPVFSSLTINSDGNVICCLVDGSVVVLSTYGSVVWKARTGGPIFAGPCTSRALPSQVLICSRDGSIYSFEMGTGNLIWKQAIGHPITSSPYVDENSRVTSASSSPLCDRLICVCDSSGSIRVLSVVSNVDGEFKQNMEDLVQEFARFDLQGDVFSSPVMIGGRIFVGCRDDHVYCIKLDVE